MQYKPRKYNIAGWFEIMVLSCKGLCARLVSKRFGSCNSLYNLGYKRCSECEFFIKIEKNRCPCCRFHLRYKKRGKKDIPTNINY